MTKAAGIILTTLLLTGLTACAPETTDEPAPAVEPTHTVEPTPTAAPEPAENAPVNIPGCSELLTDPQIVALFDSSFETITGDTASRLQEGNRGSLGPVAQDTLGQVNQLQECTWGVPASDIIYSLLVAELPTDARDHFISELRNSVYTESTANNVTEFYYDSEMFGTWYGFIGDIWVAGSSQGEDGSAGRQVIDNLRALHPTLSG